MRGTDHKEVRKIIRRLSTRPSDLKDYEGNEDLPVTRKQQPYDQWFLYELGGLISKVTTCSVTDV